MDKEFQTTFIPKKPLAEQKVSARNVTKKPVGIFTLVATIIFIITLLGAGGVLFFERYVQQQIAEAQASLERAEKAFEPSLIIELQELDTRLQTADELLTEHIAVSPIFRILENLTLKSVEYTTFQYDIEGQIGNIKLTGLARRYQTIAEQSLLFGQSRFIEEHIFSDFTLNEEGRVTFNLSLTISPELLLFTRSLGEVPSEDEPTINDAVNNALNTQTQPIVDFTGDSDTTPTEDIPEINDEPANPILGS